jgi:exosortase
VIVVALAGCLLWLYGPTLAEMAERWGRDARYSHGYLVPLFSLYLLWRGREQLGRDPLQPSWWGLPLLAAGLIVRLLAGHFYLPWLASLSLLPCLAGLFLMVGGRPALRWSGAAIAFLVFMMPLPYQAEVALARPLQQVATLASTYSLQTLGFAAFAEGNVIRMGTVRIGVVEACSGLSMLTAFFALATAAALVLRRPWPERALLVASAVPIALVANVIRVTATGALHRTAGREVADLVFHDLAGWLMMPLALGLLWAELRLLNLAFPERPPCSGAAHEMAFVPPASARARQ